MNETYRGIEGTTFVWRGTQSDPLVIYESNVMGKVTMNYWDVDECMVDRLFGDDYEWHGTNEEYDQLQEYIDDNHDYVYSILEELAWAIGEADNA